MKKTAYLLIVAVLACAAPVFAQGPFTDVPTDHWAYDAVNQLQKDGILIGYPDGTFSGKRTITRYEFAVALARAYDALKGGTGVPGATGLTKAEVQEMLNDYVRKDQLPPSQANAATKADVEAVRKLVDEFKDELAALGVDVDALKRDVAALSARVDAIEAEMKRVRFFGDATVFAIAGATTSNLVRPAIDLDQRTLGQTLGREISVVKDFDLKVVGRISESTNAVAVINYGNYLNYLDTVDDFVGGPRPTTKGGGSFSPDTLSDNFFPYYLYIDAGFGKGALTVGRFPLQFTPYTLKLIDVDSYTNIMKTSDGNYPVDGAKLATSFGGVDLTLFAAKNDENDYLRNGLTGQPNAGVYTVSGPFHQLATGRAVGGLRQVTQSAGVRAVIGTPLNGVLGATFYQAWDRNGFLVDYDQARVFGADLTIGLPFVRGLNLTGSWTQCDTLATDRAPATIGDIDYLNTAWDGKLSYGFGKLGLGAGYKSISRNFAAAGYWDKIGRWTNPTDIKGPYVDLSYPFSDSLKLALNGEFLKIKDTVAPVFVKDDDIIKAEAALSWGFSAKNTIDAGYQWVRFDPTGVGVDKSTETYITLGLSHQMNPNAALKVAYQLISYDGAPTLRPYFNDYNGGLGVVQFGVSF